MQIAQERKCGKTGAVTSLGGLVQRLSDSLALTALCVQALFCLSLQYRAADATTMADATLDRRGRVAALAPPCSTDASAEALFPARLIPDSVDCFDYDSAFDAPVFSSSIGSILNPGKQARNVHDQAQATETGDSSMGHWV